ncbi:DUF2987 domain-containing protein [Alteromonas pelagimontana]|uniref:DUF2987 domain-containing protein n=1 Tax=Alteromonas pelagimontana TaxID=1858656 RepID=A0A6M4M8J5_9ALTE|nr:DUF2987 domain-containing protein [Alteromonas pelagimontana]QJR79309.1 DUF2987 domain-containing protein [Alteromonas pelagimontana]QJR82667.1 DUF2987 domain-containing protein [Alteromonas pelagimontana]
MKKLTFLLCAFLTFSSYAEVLNVEYSRFYSHVRKLNDEDTKALQFAFGFVRVGEGHLCKINDAKIVTQKQTLPLEVTSENRFTVPSEKVLKMAEAVVRIDLEEAANVCDMSVQLETKPEYLKTEYTAEELDMLLEQYRSFFNEMGSFLSFMMPSVEGLLFHFENGTLNTAPKDTPAINGGMLMLKTQWLEQKKSLSLPEKPLRITAIASKG